MVLNHYKMSLKLFVFHGPAVLRPKSVDYKLGQNQPEDGFQSRNALLNLQKGNRFKAEWSDLTLTHPTTSWNCSLTLNKGTGPSWTIIQLWSKHKSSVNFISSCHDQSVIGTNLTYIYAIFDKSTLQIEERKGLVPKYYKEFSAVWKVDTKRHIFQNRKGCKTISRGEQVDWWAGLKPESKRWKPGQCGKIFDLKS